MEFARERWFARNKIIFLDEHAHRRDFAETKRIQLTWKLFWFLRNLNSIEVYYREAIPLSAPASVRTVNRDELKMDHMHMNQINRDGNRRGCWVHTYSRIEMMHNGFMHNPNVLRQRVLNIAKWSNNKFEHRIVVQNGDENRIDHSLRTPDYNWYRFLNFFFFCLFIVHFTVYGCVLRVLCHKENFVITRQTDRVLYWSNRNRTL